MDSKRGWMRRSVFGEGAEKDEKENEKRGEVKDIKKGTTFDKAKKVSAGGGMGFKRSRSGEAALCVLHEGQRIRGK